MKVDVLPAKLEVTRDEDNKVQSAVLKIGGQFAAPFKYVAWEVTLDDLAHLQPVEPKQGEWGEWDESNGYPCSVCGEYLPYTEEYDYQTPFCPNCGARMKEGDESDGT